jgi:hypothetical protein
VTYVVRVNGESWQTAVRSRTVMRKPTGGKGAVGTRWGEFASYSIQAMPELPNGYVLGNPEQGGTEYTHGQVLYIRI